MILSITEKARYKEDGYCVVRNLIPRNLISPANKRLLEIPENRPDWPINHFHFIDPDRYRTSDGKPLAGGLQRPALQEEVFQVIADHPNLQEAMAGVLGGPVIRYTDQIGIKHGHITEEQGSRSYYHQDSYYWKIEPNRGCNCWIPFSQAGKDAIALSIMPKSHQAMALMDHEAYFDDPPYGGFKNGNEFHSFQRFRIKAEDIDYSREHLIEMEPGDGLFFTNYTWHRSEPNRSGENKAFYAIAYQLESNG